MYRAIYVNATQPITAALEQVVGVFADAGWDVVSEETTEAIVASQPINNKVLYVKWRASTDEETSSEPHGTFKWGLFVSIARAREGNNFVWTPEFASTIFHGGQYDFIIAPHAFVILPPTTQTHRFAFGTWCALLAPLPGVTSDGDYTPFVLLGDRAIGMFERAYSHATLNSAPVYFLQLPNGSALNLFFVLHPTMGRRVIFQRERWDYIAPLMVMVEAGGALSPILYSPDWFVESTPRQQTYIPTQQSVELSDFLVPKMIYYGSVRVLPCGLLPPDGAKLLSVF